MKQIKKILTLLLCAVMVLSLAACGGNTGSGGNNAGGGSGSGSNTGSGSSSSGSGTTAPAEETYVYVSEFVPIGELNSYPQAPIYRDGRFLTSTYAVIGDATPEGVTPEWEGQYAVYGTKFYWLNLDGSVEELTAYEPVPAPTFEDVEAEVTSSSFVSSFIITPDGSVAVLESTYSSWYDGPDDGIEMYTDEWYSKGYYIYQHNEQAYYLRILNDDGSEKLCIDLAELSEGNENFYVSGFSADAAGNFYVLATGVTVINSEGEIVKTIGGDQWLSGISALPDGRVAVTVWGMAGQQMVPIDPVTLELDNANAFTAGATSGGGFGFGFGFGGFGGGSSMTPTTTGDYDFIYTNGSNLMGYKLADGSTEKILNWINCDVNPNNATSPTMMEDGRIVTLETTWSSDFTTTKNSFVILSKVPASSVEQKQTLTLATQALEWGMQDQIIKFNRSSPDFRIELRDYSEYNTQDDASAGVTKLSTELLAGNMPDIIDLAQMPVGQLESKGLLSDLYPLLNGDAELKDAIFPSVLKAMESNGKLYRTAPTFQLFTVLGAASIVGDQPGWTLKDFKTALSNMPEGCEPFNAYTTRSTILDYCINMNWDSLVNWETGECFFNTGLFADILSFANEFPTEAQWDMFGGWNEQDQENNRIATGRQMLTYTWLYDFSSWQQYDLWFGGDSTMIGFPVANGVGNAFQFTSNGYAISSNCQNKDAAWQFIRTMFTEDYQDANAWQFPTNMASFQKKLDTAMTPDYEKDENGNYLLDENGERIQIPKNGGFGFGFGFGFGGNTEAIYALTQEQADEIMSIINSTDKVYDRDDDLMSVITTDCEAFFSGQKSADEVASLLQSKMTIYVNEQR